MSYGHPLPRQAYEITSASIEYCLEMANRWDRIADAARGVDDKDFEQRCRSEAKIIRRDILMRQTP